MISLKSIIVINYAQLKIYEIAQLSEIFGNKIENQILLATSQSIFMRQKINSTRR